MTSSTLAAPADPVTATVDPGHRHPIYVAGYSNGGRLAYQLACRAPGLFDGTAVVKAMPDPGCAVTRPLTAGRRLWRRTAS